MAASQIAKLFTPARRWLWGIGLGLPALLGVVLVILVAITWLTSTEYRAPEEWIVGHVDDLRENRPLFVDEPRLWVVKLASGEVMAFYDRDPESGCAVPFRSAYEFSNRKGWFRDACHGNTYDLTGGCFGGVCVRGLDRFRVEITEKEAVVVKLRDLTRGPPADFTAAPVTP